VRKITKFPEKLISSKLLDTLFSKGVISWSRFHFCPVQDATFFRNLCLSPEGTNPNQEPFSDYAYHGNVTGVHIDSILKFGLQSSTRGTFGPGIYLTPSFKLAYRGYGFLENDLVFVIGARCKKPQRKNRKPNSLLNRTQFSEKTTENLKNSIWDPEFKNNQIEWKFRDSLEVEVSHLIVKDVSHELAEMKLHRSEDRMKRKISNQMLLDPFHDKHDV